MLSSDRIQFALYSFTRSQLLFSAIDLDVFKAIHQGRGTVDELVPILQVDGRALKIFLDGLIGIGFLQKTPEGCYILPPDVAQFLVKGEDQYIGGMVKHCKRLYENWMLLTDVIKSGQPAGGSQSLADVETFFSELVKGLYVSNYPTAQKLAEFLKIGSELKGIKILDVAGGSGVWSIAMLEKDAGSTATVLDYPTVVHVAEEYVTHHGLEGRYDYFPADLEITEFPKEQYDLAVLANICHGIGPYSTETLFQKTFHALKPGGKIVIVDFVPDDQRSQPGWPLIFGVNMLVCTQDGNVFTEAEYRQWLSAAGFSCISKSELEDVAVIVAKKISFKEN
jgi:ubiquinone/menaquinone biosynthesis C-methylase UbiE